MIKIIFLVAFLFVIINAKYYSVIKSANGTLSVQEGKIPNALAHAESVELFV